MHKIFFYNKFIIRLYMFRALCAHHQEVKIVLYSIWYHHKVAFIQLLKLFGVHLLYITCRTYRKCNLTVVKTCLPCRWPSRAQVESVK